MSDRSVRALRAWLARGLVIPACPLALTADRRFDERHQRALIRYYVDAGAGGLAVGVHTTQFAIHDPKVGLYQPVLESAARTVGAHGSWTPKQSQAYDGDCSAQTARNAAPVMVAGLVGDTAQACREAALAVALGYDCGLLSLAALRDADDAALLAHCRAVADIIPLFGFYLQPAVGGRVLPYSFWRRFAEIERVVAIKIAPFNRYQTLDVVRAVADSGRGGEIALYTGNDDHIVEDLLAEYRFGDVSKFHPATGAEPAEAAALRQAQGAGGAERKLRIVGGLLGHWAVWTQRAAEIVAACHAPPGGLAQGLPLRVLASQITDCNAALFDAAHNFAGCIAGIHEVLRRQGLLAGRWLLDPREDLSPGQVAEIDRVCAAYPHLNDDKFVSENLDRWLR